MIKTSRSTIIQVVSPQPNATAHSGVRMQIEWKKIRSTIPKGIPIVYFKRFFSIFFDQILTKIPNKFQAPQVNTMVILFVLLFCILTPIFLRII
jgi:hypothetical protein